MTEAEWLAATDPTPMLELIRGKASERKQWLFICACDRRNQEHMIPEAENHIIWTERYADGHITQGAYHNFWEERAPGFLDFSKLSMSDWTEASIANATRRAGGNSTLEEAFLASILRDIFGNPFRPVTVDPSWLTSTVVALAEGIYADRAFDRTPVLADALQDAGCDNDDILTHLRGDGPHVRGCWAVDLLLGKE